MRVAPEVVEYRILKQVAAQSRPPSTTGGKLFLIHDVGRDVTEREETGIELLLSEPEIVAWLEPQEHTDDDDDEQPRAS